MDAVPVVSCKNKGKAGHLIDPVQVVPDENLSVTKKRKSGANDEPLQRANK